MHTTSSDASVGESDRAAPRLSSESAYASVDPTRLGDRALDACRAGRRLESIKLLALAGSNAGRLSGEVFTLTETSFAAKSESERERISDAAMAAAADINAMANYVMSKPEPADETHKIDHATRRDAIRALRSMGMELSDRTRHLALLGLIGDSLVKRADDALR